MSIANKSLKVKNDLEIYSVCNHRDRSRIFIYILYIITSVTTKFSMLAVKGNKMMIEK